MSSRPEGGEPRRNSPKYKDSSNMLRFLLSAQEYKSIHLYLISRSRRVRKKLPTTSQYEALINSKDDYNAAAIRATIRVFIASQAGLQAWEVIKRLISRGRQEGVPKRTSLLKSPNLRLSISLSSILLFHQILYRFFSRLRANLLTAEARPFRRRNPKVSKALVSRLAPAIGASLAGFMLGIYPQDQLRMTVAIYFLTRAGEFGYNHLEAEGWFRNRPWWLGSWMIMPVACGQLLHAFVFDRDCFPRAYGNFVMSYGKNYIQHRPEAYPSHLPWPGTYEIVDSLATMARLNWPPFVSPILFPTTKTLPSALSQIGPITSAAHPLHTSLSCALLHPSNPSCLTENLAYHVNAIPSLAKFFTLIFGALAIPRYASFIKDPVSFINKLSRQILKMTMFLSLAIGSSWGSICLFQNILPRTFLPTQRFFLGGFIGGLFGFLQRNGGRGQFLYSARASIDSAWKVGRKRGWWRGVRGGDVWIFVASLAVMNAIYDGRNMGAIDSGIVRRGLGSVRGQGLGDALVKKEDMGDAENEGKET